MATLDEKLEEMARIKAELQRMEADGEVTEENSADLRDTMIARWEQLDTETKPIISQMERLRGITRAADNPANTEAGSDPGQREWGKGPEFMRRMDPFADMDKVENRMVTPRDMVARAQTATENANRKGMVDDRGAQEAVRKAQENPWIARHMLLFGSDDYADAFRQYLNAPEEISRTPLALATANGGVMLPTFLDPTVVLTNDASANPFRRISHVESITTNAYHGVSSAGVTAAWLGEATAAADASPTFGAITVYPKKAAAWVYGSFEIIQDTNFGDQLPRLLSDAKDRLEEQAFAAGTGSNTDNTGTPAGVAAALGTTTRHMATNTTGGAFFAGTAGQADVYATQAALAPRWRQSQSLAWVSSLYFINKIRSIDQYGGGAFWANLNVGSPASGLLGAPVYESTSIATATATGATTAYAAAVYGDFSQFYIIDRIGTQMLYEPLVKATSVIGAPTGQSGWFMYWRVGSAVANATSFAWQLNGTA